MKLGVCAHDLHDTADVEVASKKDETRDNKLLLEIFCPIIPENNELSSDDQSMSNLSIFSFHDEDGIPCNSFVSLDNKDVQNVSDNKTHNLTNFNVAPTKLNQAFLNYLMHIFLAFMIFPRFLNQTSIKISNTFKKILCQKYSQRYLLNQESLDDIYGLRLYNISHWDDSLRDAVLLQNTKESSNEPFTTDDSKYIDNRIANNSKCMGENIPNDLQISITS